MAEQVKGASLDPSTHTKGAMVPDGEFIIKTVLCDEFTYPGRNKTVPAIMVLYADPHDSSVTYEQAYSAGDLSRLVPSNDKRRMVHPRGEAAAYAQGSNASLWLSSVTKAGYVFQGDDVTQIQGMKVTLTSVAQEKRAGLKDQVEGKTITLVSKILAMPGQKAATTVRPTAAAATPGSTASPAASSTVNGDIDNVAIQAVMQALDAAPERSLKVKGLAVRCLKFTPKGTALNDLTKLITPEWLVSQAEATGWTTDGEVVALATGWTTDGEVVAL